MAFLTIGGSRVHARSLAAPFVLQIRGSRCVGSARTCPPVLSLLYSSRTRGALSIFKTDDGCELGTPARCERRSRRAPLSRARGSAWTDCSWRACGCQHRVHVMGDVGCVRLSSGEFGASFR